MTRTTALIAVIKKLTHKGVLWIRCRPTTACNIIKSYSYSVHRESWVTTVVNYSLIWVRSSVKTNENIVLCSCTEFLVSFLLCAHTIHLFVPPTKYCTLLTYVGLFPISSLNWVRGKTWIRTIHSTCKEQARINKQNSSSRLCALVYLLFYGTIVCTVA